MPVVSLWDGDTGSWDGDTGPWDGDTGPWDDDTGSWDDDTGSWDGDTRERFARSLGLYGCTSLRSRLTEEAGGDSGSRS